MITKSISIISCCFISLFFSVTANSTESEDAKVRQFVTSVSEEILNIIKDDQPESKKEIALSILFDKYVDTNWMSQFVLGRYNRKITPEDRQKYSTLYHRYMKMTYIPRFRLYNGQTYKIVRVKPKNKSDYIVDVLFNSNDKNGPDLNLNYHITTALENLKIRDIVGEGVSFVITQRSDFGSLIKREGIKKFISKLEKKVLKMEEENAKKFAKNEIAN